MTRCDYNRCGIPLIEIVTEPDLCTAGEAVSYLERLKETLQYLGVSGCRMQEGSLRCDVNLSVRPAGSDRLGTRTEMKNLGSFRAVSRAIAWESARQIALLEAGGAVAQETRRWDEDREASFAMRAKENAQDYRYFPEPDLPPLEFSGAYLERLRAQQPELAAAKRERYQADWGLPAYDTEMLTSQRALAEFFEQVVALGTDPKQAANWIMGEGKLNRNTAVKVFEAVFETDGDVDAYVRAHGLEQVSDANLVARVVEEVLAASEKSVADYRAGKEKAFGFLVGQVMRRLKGQAAPAVVHQVLREKLGRP